MHGRTSDCIRYRFNRSANSYDTVAHVQRMMSELLAKSYTEWKTDRKITGLDILEIGCGTGTLTEVLAREWPEAMITALDIAPAMINLAKQRVHSAADRLRFLQADVETWASEAPRESYDLIVSNACFQWLLNPSQTLGHIRRMLRPEGMLIFTTFGPETFREMHMAFNEVYRAGGMVAQRHGLSFLSTMEWNHLLQSSGFSNIRNESLIQTEKYASARDFLHSVKAMGASTSEAVSTPGIRLRRLFASMYKEYEEKFSLDGGVAASYELLLIRALADR